MNSSSQPRDVLLLEPDRAYRSYMSSYLSNHGFSVTSADNQHELLALANRHRFGLALIDASLCSPARTNQSGWAAGFCRRTDLGVILLSAEGGSRESVRALNLGADDYVCKPFHEAELLARIRAVMRRYPASNSDDSTRAGEWRLSLTGRHIAAPGGKRIRLTGRELDLLELLAEQPGQAVSRDHISMSLMGREWLPGDRSMDVLVRRLRSKLAPIGGAKLIRTERHIGYSLIQVQVPH